MELDSIIKLIETVSASNLTSFQYTEGDLSLSFEIKPHSSNIVQVTPGFMQVPSNQMPESLEAKPELKAITSPMVGTFYQSKSEDSDPFITVGDRVKKGQIIGIIEAMKLMNEIESEYDGIVEEILVKNKNMVEYGQVLVRIKPNN
ncbi:MAG: acetyl-CoA carboxylase, biotin carboxyl carrier protein [Anaerocolumna sp.]|nr:acetyl-CoA carboxylase, biotin carboxyl carrier protein [Anaerocolumna sp.]